MDNVTDKIDKIAKKRNLLLKIGAILLLAGFAALFIGANLEPSYKNLSEAVLLFAAFGMCAGLFLFSAGGVVGVERYEYVQFKNIAYSRKWIIGQKLIWLTFAWAALLLTYCIFGAWDEPHGGFGWCIVLAPVMWVAVGWIPFAVGLFLKFLGNRNAKGAN